ncbi:tyrosine-protein phosphatase [Paenibacillus protaetiae]|uniref:Tyrosine-protein phosphatase n=1 Tax=Paenibacillus protaetiae TaxID=2509456 RepID=A0A4P6F9R1_9BACL|nr:tyrosine-protein phosphatase [Paenibacillus protaetiae]QAY67228.1 tyrosine-protein phosphatase [Paenibacillus protaetiae]
MTATTNEYPRLLRLEGACNARDIGGYAAAGGKTVQTGRLFRADGLHRLTAQDQQLILGKGVRTIIDLRHAAELAQKPNVFAGTEGVNYINISLINPATASMAQIRTLGDMYVNMLDECGHLLLQVFESIAAEEEQNVLFHCAGGKDRTGVVAALLLDLAGVDRAAIVADYAETEHNLAPLMQEFQAERPAGISAEQYQAFLGSAPANMEQMLDHLYDRYNGAEAYLSQAGLSRAQLDAIKRKLLEA